MLNRREIFKNLLGLMALTAIPATVLAKEVVPDWGRVTKRKVILDIQKAIETAMQDATLELNDPITRQTVTEYVRNVANRHKLNRNLYDYQIVCNEVNNTDKVIDKNEMHCDVYLKFPNEVTFTKLTAVAGRDVHIFEEVVGSLA